MLTLDVAQSALVAAEQKDVRWSFYVYDKNGVGYSFISGSTTNIIWATGITWDAGLTWDNGEGLSTILLTDFSGIELRRNMAENTVIAPSEVTFNISNPSNTLTFTDFKGGSVLIALYLTDATYGERKIASWKFYIKTADPSYQQLRITAVDFLQQYLKGSYPNTRLPDDVFPSNRTYNNSALCVPVPFGTAYVPLRDVFITGDGGYIMLGDPLLTYTITSLRSPRSWGLKSEYSSGDFTFTQSTKADADSVNWKVFQAIIADSNSDGVADAAGCWLTPGGPTLDAPVQFTRSDTATMTSPADVIEFVLKDMGVPAAMIDAVSFAAAKVIYAAWGLTFNGAFWYKQDRQKVIASLLTMCHSCLDIGETVKLRVLSKTSMATITSSDVIRTSEQGIGTFSYRDIANEDYSDAGYVAYQPTGEAQDEFIKVLVAVDGSADVISSEVVECPFVQDAQDVKRIGQLHFERKLMKTAEASFTTKGTRLALQPDDRITIDDSNYGGTYAVLVDSVKISKDLTVQFNCSDYSIAFNDWADLSPTDITIPSDTTSSSWQPVMSGPDTVTGVSGVGSNVLPGRLRIGSTDSFILLEPADPLHVSVFESDVETTRMGNLNGFDGYTTDVFGFAVRGPGKIGGWKIQPTLIQSDVAGAARIELDQGNARISVKDSTNAYKTVMGYLNGLAKHDGTGDWGAGDYGFWAASGDTLKIDGDANYKSGDWVVENDGSFLIQNAASQNIVILGTVSGVKGLYLYDSVTPTQNLLAKFTTAEAFIGEATKYLQYTVAGGLVVVGSVTATSGAIGGWQIGATSLSDVAGLVGMSSAVTAGDDIRFWAGHVTPGSAPFRVTEAGVVTATSGSIGGWSLASTYIYYDGAADANSAGMALSDYPFYAGKKYADRATAPFRVTPAGVLTASGATISGDITATAGVFTGVINIGSAGQVFIDGTNEIIKVFSTTVTIETGTNDDLDWTEDGSTKTVALIADDYTPTDLAAHVQTQMRSVGDVDTVVTYSAGTRKITIANSTLTTLTFLWNSGTNNLSNCGNALGFDVSADDTGALTYAADYQCALRVELGKIA